MKTPSVVYTTEQRPEGWVVLARYSDDPPSESWVEDGDYATEGEALRAIAVLRGASETVAERYKREKMTPQEFDAEMNRSFRAE